MNTVDLVNRLKAYGAGRPIPSGSTLHLPIAEPRRRLIVAFLRMGGETLPWGVGFRVGTGRSVFLTVPDPRKRDLVAEEMVEFSDALVGFLRRGADAAASDEEDPPITQVWVPGGTHVDMLQFLAYAYTHARTGDEARVESVRRLGRAANWLFQEGERMPNVALVNATEALRGSFVFPAEPTRQLHLGFLIGWLRTKGGDNARRQAAHEAELRSVAAVMDPTIEREQLERLVETWNESPAGSRHRAAAEQRIREVLSGELARRIDLVAATIDALEGDKRDVNPGLDRPVKTSMNALARKIDLIETGDGYVAGVDSDHDSRAAANRFLEHDGWAEERTVCLAHHDEELQLGLVAAGEAIGGKIVNVVDEGTGRASRPVWFIECSGDRAWKLREGARVCVAGESNRTGEIRRSETLRNARRRVEFEITGGKTGAVDPTRRGRDVVLLAAPMTFLNLKKKRAVWQKGAPGDWIVAKQEKEVRDDDSSDAT